MISFTKGKRVNTPQGPGKIVYVRMAPPTYSEVASVSVALESRQNEPGYSGTIFKAEDISQ
jgi:hypothetical protein